MRQLARLELGSEGPAGPERGHYRRQPRHRQHRRDHPGDCRTSQGPRRQAVHRAGHGQPRRRHRRGTAAAPRVLRHHRGVRRLPDPLEHGNRRRRPRGRRVSRSISTAWPSRPITCWSATASSRTPASAGPIESGLMKMLLIGLGKCEGAKVYHRAIQDFSFDQIIRSVAGEVLAPLPHPGRPGHRRKRLRPDGADRGRAARGVRGPREGVARAGQAADAAAAVSTRRRAADRPHRQGHQRHGPRPERGGPEVQRPQGRRGRVAEGAADRPARA